MDDNTEVEMILDKNRLMCIKRTPIVIGDAVNGLFKVDEKNYIMAGVSYKADCEHYKYDGENVIKFGTLPNLISGEEDYMVWQYNYKMIAGRPDKDVFFDFYTEMNLIRKYDINGTLLNEIKLKGHFQKENSYETFKDLKSGLTTPYWLYARPTSKYIYVLFYQGQSRKQLSELYKANLSNRNIAKILNSSDSAISYARKRLYKKMSGCDGTGEDLNKLIADL